jgi:tetratricopeptide (TPR) repeat protein
MKPTLPLSCLLLLSLYGCQSGQLDDPNSLENIQGEPARMMANLREARETLDMRVAKNQLTSQQRDQLMLEKTKKYLEITDKGDVTDENAWIYGDLYRDAGMWKEAFSLYDRARKAAKNEDRRVNDNLRFSRAAGQIGKVKDAIAAVRSTFSTPPKEKAPILPALIFEVIPSCEGKGSDLELARLLEEGISQHNATVVDAETDPGKAFLIARPAHIQRAFTKVVDLYVKAGRRDLARQAIRRADDMGRNFGSA